MGINHSHGGSLSSAGQSYEFRSTMMQQAKEGLLNERQSRLTANFKNKVNQDKNERQTHV